MVFDIKNYYRRPFPVLCDDGTVADSVTGECRLSENTIDANRCGSENRFVRVNKRTISTYYTSVYECDEGKLHFYVLQADRVNRHGLNWQIAFEGVLTPEESEVQERGEGSIKYWHSSEMFPKLLSNVLVPRRNNVTAETCITDLWKKNFVPDELKELTMRKFVALWMRRGAIAEYFSPAAMMKKQKFGVEIEFTGMTRALAAKVLAVCFRTEEYYAGTAYKSYKVTDEKGRIWKINKDSSIKPMTDKPNVDETDYQCELVTPICGYNDIPRIQQIIRLLRQAGMVINSTCGLHVHVDGEGHDIQSIKNLVNIIANRENMLFKALGTYSRRSEWCRKVDTRFLSEIQKIGSGNELTDIRRIWYNGMDMSSEHYNETRYHALNLHSLWQGKGIEFRMFNSTTHAGKVKAYIQLCLAISNQAKTQQRISFKEKQTLHEKRQFRTWLTQMGMVGEEFATARKHLLENLVDVKENAA